ncbi:hypothetical protein A3194_02580 [Candidatus Thiodiazotropha endoloripes]|nr:hypothetical protein A3194_02580 [Candidatus Thiodiazotropha endoloripes]
MVVKHSGHAKLGILQSLIQSLLKAITDWWSFVFVLMTKGHQALHDLLAGSVVVLNNRKDYLDTSSWRSVSRIATTITILHHSTSS